jgi:hypothetical protein
LFCIMTSSNDNQPRPETARLLPVVGKVDPRGAIVLRPSVARRDPGDRASTVVSFPNDPRET